MSLDIPIQLVKCNQGVSNHSALVWQVQDCSFQDWYLARLIVNSPVFTSWTPPKKKTTVHHGRSKGNGHSTSLNCDIPISHPLTSAHGAFPHGFPVRWCRRGQLWEPVWGIWVYLRNYLCVYVHLRVYAPVASIDLAFCDVLFHLFT